MNTNGNNILNTPFDQYQRYKTASLIIEELRNGSNSFSILEIGANEHKNLENFLPNDIVKYLDIQLPEVLKQDPQYILANATAMPEIETDSYDILIALDVFEHIPSELRDNFLGELNRVAKVAVILAGPFDEIGVNEAEIRVNEYFKTKFGMDYIWLEEHIENGLPNLSNTISVLESKYNRCITHFKHGSLYLWEKLTRIHFEVASNTKLQNYRQNIDFYYNKNIFISDVDENCYRDFIICSTNKLNFSSYFKIQHKNEQKLNILNDLIDSTYRLSVEQNFLHIKEKDQQIKEKDQQIKEKDQQIKEKDQQIQNLNNEVIHLHHITQSMRIKNRIKSFIKKFIPQKIWKILRYMKNNPSAIKLGLYVLKTQGIKAFLKRVSKIDSLTECRIINSYKYNEPKFNDDIEQELKEFNKKPLISIIMPVYNVDPKWLELAIKSVEKQWYENWELCITDDKSTNSKTIEYLKSIKNPKIKIKFLERNLNISGASNEALTLASGEYIALMDNDDEITPDALYEVLRVINNTDSEFIYSDEDKMNREGNCLNPYFKPDYSYDLLLSLNYICHFSVIKKSIIDEIKGFNTQYNGAQDYDLFLRVIEKTNKIYHIPKILYHWRMIETSTAMSSATKPYAHDAGKKAVQSHFDRMGIRAKVIDSEYTFVLDVDYEMPNINPLVSIIMPTKDAVNYLETCINSIVNLSTYKNYEILILNNNSEKEETFEWFKKVQQKYSFVKVIEANYEFNWSKLNNHGIKEAKGDVYIFLNNDIEIITPNWIERLASKALQPNVGAVGALLLFEDDTIQHAGVVVGLNGWADHLYRTAQPVHLYINYTSPMVNKNVLAVTGACVAISKKTIENIGNFSEDFLICGSDVEICLRAYEKGYRNILDANTKLYHFESKTRSSYVPECDFEMSRKAYKYYWENGDPFYNKNLSLNGNLPNIRN